MERPLCIIETRQEISLSTVFDFPPIPIRGLDWHAIDAKTYDADYLGEDETGSVWKFGAIGTGRTEADAVNSLIDELLAA